MSIFLTRSSTYTPTVSMDLFLRRVMLEAPLCPDPLALDAVRATCIDFCHHTWFWRYDLPAISVVDGVATYALTPLPANTVVSGIREVRMAGVSTPVPPTTQDWLADNVPDWRTREERYPIAYLVPQVGEIQLIGIPTENVADALTITLAIKPSWSATMIFEPIYNDHLETITNGALAHLLAMKSKEWADPALSTFYRSRYEAGRNSAKAATTHGHVRSNLSVQPRALA